MCCPPHALLTLGVCLPARELHEEQFGLDAVLLAEGGHVGAHCAVLAAASPFLKTLLLHAADHPAIISVTGTYARRDSPFVRLMHSAQCSR